MEAFLLLIGYLGSKESELISTPSLFCGHLRNTGTSLCPLAFSPRQGCIFLSNLLSAPLERERGPIIHVRVSKSYGLLYCLYVPLTLRRLVRRLYSSSNMSCMLRIEPLAFTRVTTKTAWKNWTIRKIFG